MEKSEKLAHPSSEANSSTGEEKSLLSLPAHCLSHDAVVRELGTDPEDGLTVEEAKRRLETYGPNMLEGGEGVSVVKILVRQVANAMMLVKRPTSLSPFLSPCLLYGTLFV